MGKWLRFAALVVLLVSSAARGNSWGLDRSDLWWNPTESGWGVMMTQQQDSIFIATFLYAPDGKGTWFNGLLTYNGSNYEGQLIESGAQAISATSIRTRLLGVLSVPHD